jgi:diguanylate cyclase (GGDEF)-like protein
VGGEEFAVILPGSGRSDALMLAEGLRRQVEAQSFSFEGKPIPVTVSLGAGALAANEGSDAFYKRIDEFLYHSKHSGRNRVSG